MKVKEDQQRLKELLKDTITLLCKNGLQYKDELSVEALIGITLDQNNVFLVNIKETVQMPNKNGEASDSSDYSDNESSNKFEQVTSPKSGKKRRYSENTSGTSMTPSKQQKIQPVAVKETVLDIKNEESECDNDEDLVFVKEEQQGVRQQITPPMGSVFPGSYGSPVVKVTGGTAASGDLTIQNTTSIDSSSFMQQSPGMWGGSKTAGNQQNYTCTMCYKQYMYKGSLQEHMRGTHGLGEPFSCKKCGKTFTWRGSRNAHLKICNGSDTKGQT